MDVYMYDTAKQRASTFLTETCDEWMSTAECLADSGLVELSGLPYEAYSGKHLHWK